VPNIFDGMDVDLVGRPSRPGLGIPHTGALGRATGPRNCSTERPCLKAPMMKGTPPSSAGHSHNNRPT
jgi:hypothetical protein